MSFIFADHNAVTFNDGASVATAVVPDTMMESVQSLAGAYERARSRLQPAALIEQMRADGVPSIRLFGAEVRMGGKDAAELAERRAVTLTPPPSIPTERFAEHRARWAGLNEGEQMMRALAAEVEELAALIDGGRTLSNVTSDEAWRTIEQRSIRTFHLARTGVQARYSAKPSIHRLIVHGPDRAAAEQAADEALERFQAEHDAIEAREVQLQSTLALLAVVTGRDPATVLAEALA